MNLSRFSSISAPKAEQLIADSAFLTGVPICPIGAPIIPKGVPFMPVGAPIVPIEAPIMSIGTSYRTKGLLVGDKVPMASYKTDSSFSILYFSN